MKNIGKYKIGKMIGRGAMGMVHKGTDEKGRSVAIKTMHAHLADIGDYTKRFVREAQLAEKLAHPNVVKVVDHGCENDTYYIVMEFVQGKTLGDLMLKDQDIYASLSDIPTFVETKKPDGCVIESNNTNLIIKVMRQISGVLQAANDIGLIHRDIKPQNILIDKKGNAKLLDFGLAKDTESLASMLSMTGQTIGTPPYMSPEQHEGKIEVDIRSDLYSLGITAYQMLAGRCPFEAKSAVAIGQMHLSDIPESLNSIDSNIPLNLSQVIDRLLAKNPDDRHQTPAELIEDLNRVERGEVPSKLHKFKRSRKHNPLFSYGFALIAVIVALLAYKSYIVYVSYNAKPLIAAQVAEAQNLLAENHYDKALGKINSVISEFSAEHPLLVKDAESLRGEIPKLKKAYFEKQAKIKEAAQVANEAKRLAEINRLRDVQEQLRKQNLSSSLRNVQRWMVKEELVSKAVAEIETAYSLAKTDVELKQVDELKVQVDKYYSQRRPWAAVVNFTVSESVTSKIAGDAIAVILESSITKYQLVERGQITKAIEELKFQTSDFVNKNKIQEFGKIIGAEFLITGSIVQVGNQITVAAKILEISTGRIIQTATQRTNDIENFNYLLADIAKMLVMNNADKEVYLATISQKYYIQPQPQIQAQPIVNNRPVANLYSQQLSNILKGKEDEFNNILKNEKTPIIEALKKFDEISDQYTKLSKTFTADKQVTEIFNSLEGIKSNLQKVWNGAIPGYDFIVPDIGIELVWIKDLKCWVGKYEITNEQYRKFSKFHNSGKFNSMSLNGATQPVAQISFDEMVKYSNWVTSEENKKGRNVKGMIYRLPNKSEWTIFAKCADNRIYPWGNDYPPEYGNFDKINNYSDNYRVSAPVDKSGINDFGLYGVAGNVWEATIRNKTSKTFDGWRGASWGTNFKSFLTINYRDADNSDIKYNDFGFRIILSFE